MKDRKINKSFSGRKRGSERRKGGNDTEIHLILD